MLKSIKITGKLTVVIILSFGFFNSCKKEFDYGSSKNAVKTMEFTDVLQTVATVSGTVITDNGSSLTARGICYNTSNNPTIADSIKKDLTSTLGDFSCTLFNLSPGTVYYAKAYATNNFGTAYGTVISFKTQPATIPIISTTTAANLVTATTAKSGGTITNSGASNVTGRGICYSTSVTIPTISQSKSNDGTGIGTFISSLTGLSANTRYYLRAYATNAIGTAYGDVKTFSTTSATIPVGIATTAISAITQITASGGGNITGDGGAAITSRGVCWSNSTSNPTTSNSKTTDGTGIGTFTSSLTGLTPGAYYYVRAYATNSVGIAYGNIMTFNTTTFLLTVGQNYQGGVIAYIYQPGDPGYIAGQTHGFITTTSNQNVGAQWGCSGTSIATNTTLGTGQNNTTAIINNCTTSNIAASICNNLIFGGYTDWFLPSSDELLQLYQNRTLIGGFSSAYYWSSSQYTSTNALIVNFSSGGLYQTTKTNLYYVRAIRKF
jgi:Protein of unknown function (DUF1566)